MSRSFFVRLPALMRGLCLSLLLFAAFLSSANAAVTAGLLDFNSGSVGGAVSSQNSLNFIGSGWFYDNGTAMVISGNGTFIIPGTVTSYQAASSTGPGTSSNPGIIKVASTGDAFSLTSVRVGGSGSDPFVTIVGYRSGGPVASTSCSIPASSFNFCSINFTDIDEVHFYSNTGDFALDDLAVAPYVAPLTVSPSSLSAAAVGSAYSATISASGGTAPYAYAVTSGSLPAGLSLSSAGVLSGIPTTSGNSSFTVTATDSATQQAFGSKAYTLAIAPVVPGAPTGVSATAGNGQASVSFTAPSSNGGTAITGYTVTSNPGGFTGTGASGPITVSGLTNGTAYTFTVTATNSAGSGAASAASNPVSPIALPVASAVSATVAYGSNGNAITLNLSGGAATSVAVVSSASHGTATASGTTITYTPAAGYSGSDSFTYTATNASGTSAAATVSITVAPQAPVASAVSATVGYGSSGNAITLNLSGGAATSVAVAGAASHGTATASGTSITYTPAAGYSGSDFFSYSATNGGGTSAPATVSITVMSLTSQTISFVNPGTQNFGSALTLTATASSGLAISFTSSSTGVCTVGGNVLTFLTAGSCTINANQPGNASYSAAATVSQTFTVNAVAPGAPAIGTVTAGNGQATVSFTAPASTGGAAITSYTVTSSPGNVTATGSSSPLTVTGLSGGTAYTFTVTAMNSAGMGAASAASNSVSLLAPPVANATSATVAYGSSGNAITLNLSGGAATSVAVASSASHGTAAASGTHITYTPAAAYSGSDSFTYTATNASGTSAPAVITITVAPQIPVAGAVSVSVKANSANNAVPLALSGGAAASVAVAGSPSHGTASASGTAITYTPAAGYSGSDSFSYTATNATGTSAAAVVTISVSQPLPTAGAVSLSVEADSSGNVVPLALSGGSATSVAIGRAPNHGTASVNGLSITYSPAAGFSGEDSFTYTAANAGGSSEPAMVSITVRARPDPSKDPEVIGLVSAQLATAKRFAQAQSENFLHRLESMHTRSQGLAQSKNLARGDAARSGRAKERSLFASSSALAGNSDGSSADAVSAPSSVGMRPAVLPEQDERGLQPVLLDGQDSTGAPKARTQGLSELPLSSLNLNRQSGELWDSGIEAWSAGAINLGHIGSTDSRFTSSGLSLGADWRATEKLTLGLGAGLGYERTRVGSSGTKESANSQALALYGSYQPGEGFFLDGLAGHQWLDFDSQRYASAVDQIATSQRSGNQLFASLSGGYEFLNRGLLLSPYLRFDWISTRLHQSQESGAGRYDLIYLEQTVKNKRLALGMRGEANIELSSATARPFLKFEYQHDLEAPAAAALVYADQPTGQVYSLLPLAVDRNAAVLGLGCNFDFRKIWDLGLSYQYNQGSESTRAHSLKATLKKAF
jgi:uncharacterized protein YhjY with autotransporter beta-barrel domain